MGDSLQMDLSHVIILPLLEMTRKTRCSLCNTSLYSMVFFIVGICSNMDADHGEKNRYTVQELYMSAFDVDPQDCLATLGPFGSLLFS